MQFRRQRVQKNQSPAGKDTRHELRKRGTKGFFGTIALRKPSGGLFGGGALEQPGGARGKFSHGLAQQDFANAPVGNARRAEVESLEPATLRQKTMIHFRKIMILGREPEDRDCVCSLRGQFARHMNRRERLIDTVRGSAKQSDLLPRHNSDGAIAKAVQVAEGMLIAAEDCGSDSSALQRHGLANRVREANLSPRTAGFHA